MNPAHLIIAPILLPLVMGAALLLIEDTHRRLKATLAIATTAVMLGIAVLLVLDAAAAGAVTTYRLGSWDMPFGIVLVLDRLSALMVLLVGLLALPTLTFASARAARIAPHFHSLFLFLLVGLNGAFLTGDIFNLFVFLEVLLAASYGLALHGSGIRRVRAGMHYIAVNVTGASLLLVGISLLYAVTGTLNMADLAVRIPDLTGTERGLAQAGAGILGIALLLKAGMWPLCFWLVPTYTAATAPVGAVFAIMTKVGVYAILRLWLPMFGSDAAAFASLGDSWLVAGGMLSLAFAVIGVLSAQTLAQLGGYSVLVSSGTLLAIVGTARTPVVSGALFYLGTSTLGLAMFFLLNELIERGREPDADLLAVTREAFGDDEGDATHDDEVGLVIPGSIAFIGMAFIGCALLLAGLPPLGGFLAKFTILSSLLSVESPGVLAWAIVALLIISGFATLITAVRVGMRVLWAESDRGGVRVVLLEAVPIAFLMLLCAALSVGAGSVVNYTDQAARDLESPGSYIQGVLQPHAPGASSP